MVALTSAEVKFVDTSFSVIATETVDPAFTDVAATDAVGGIWSAGLTAELANDVWGDPLIVAVTVNV